jgi:hypothetical protein
MPEANPESNPAPGPLEAPPGGVPEPASHHHDIPTRAPAGPRKCACGGSVGPDGECTQCRAKRLASATAPQSVAGERQDGVVHGPAGGANSWTDCPTAWRPKANTAQSTGASWVDNVVNGLSNLPTPIPATVSTLLMRHFHTTATRDIATILARYRQIQTAIHSSLNFECETSCDANVLAYVYSIWTHLHLCPYWFSSAVDLQAATVIHEISHDIVGADDNAYEWETAKYNAMSVSKAMNNADSFGHFAWDTSIAPPTPPTPPTPPAPPAPAPPAPAPGGP